MLMVHVSEMRMVCFLVVQIRFVVCKIQDHVFASNFEMD